MDKEPTEKVSGNNGGKREGAGRPKGVPNKATTEFRETIARVLSDNTENVAKWLEQVAETNPARALDLISKLAEYAAPKLTRAEVVGDKDNPLVIQSVVRKIIDPKADSDV